MDLKVSEEEELIRTTAARFVDRELLPREADYLKQKEPFLPPGDPPLRLLPREIAEALETRARQAGLWGLELPETADGSALGNLAQVVVHREFGRSILPFAPLALPGALQRSQLTDRIVAGELSFELAFDEVHETGELGGIKTRYREMSDGFALGRVAIDVYSPGADFYLFPAREEGSERAGLFLLWRDLPGLTIDQEVDLTTDRTVARMTLSGCRIPHDRILGYEYDVAQTIASEQLRIAARALGIGMRCLADTIEHARNRVTFGRPLAQRQAVQWMLADLSIDLQSCTWLTLEAAWRADHELPYFEEAAVAKKRAARMAFAAADTAIQIHGGYGVCKEFPFEGFYREARMMRLLYGREAEIDRRRGKRFIDDVAPR